MPIATHKPTQPPVTVQSVLPKIQSESYRGVVYDDKNLPLSSLLSYIAGAPWTVDYFAQVLGEHNDLREVDTSQSGSYQQYEKTIGLEIRVENTLSTSYDSDNSITSVSGSANIYPFMIPNVADYFVAEAADSQRALFRITQVDRKTFNRDSVYNIAYDLVGMLNADNTLFADLESKVVRSYHFSKDRLIEGLSPTLKTEEYTKIMNLKVLYQELVKYYFRTFFSISHGTLIIPGQTEVYYDSFVVNYLLKIVQTGDAPEMRSLRVIPTDRDKFLSQTQLWDLLLQRDYSGRLYSNNDMSLVSKHLFNKNTFVQGIAFSNIHYVVYPVTPDTSTLIEGDVSVKLTSIQVLNDTANGKGASFTANDNAYIKAGATYPLIHEVLADGKYVLSENFYSATANQSVLEILVKDYLKGNALDLDMLYAVTNTFRQWKRLEQFYYAPLLITLIKEADRAQYT